MSASRGPGKTSKQSGQRRVSLVRESPGWIRAFVAVAARPRLWAIAVRQTRRIARPRWWKHSPFLPLPDAGYLRFRLETAYGEAVAPAPADLVSYLEWCRSR